jgi:zinc and cadmium transporter
MNVLLYSIIATLAVSLISFVGVFSLAFKDSLFKKLVFYLVAISAGSLMGGAFLHLIPEAIESIGTEHAADAIALYVLVGFSFFFILERVLHWRHCHNDHDDCPVHPLTYLILIGDGLHNFIDGLLIVAAFSVSVELGIATTLGVILHEIPQEVSDFGVFVYGGLSKARAFLYNFASGLFAVLGAICGYLLVNAVSGAIPFLIAITAGGFIYISASDLIPALHKESVFSKSLIAFVCFFVGIALMFVLRMGHA